MDAYILFHRDGDMGRDLNAERIRSVMDRNATRLDIPLTFVTTREQLEQQLAQYPQLRFVESDDTLRPFPSRLGVMGLWIDTYLAYKTFLQTDADRLFVFEDDITLSPSFIPIANLYAKELPDDWEIFSLLTPTDTHCRWGEWLNIEGNQYVCRVYQDWSSTAYAISRRGAEKAVTDIEVNGITVPPDFYIFNYRYDGVPAVPEFAAYNLLPGVYNPAWLAPEAANSYIHSTQAY